MTTRRHFEDDAQQSLFTILSTLYPAIRKLTFAIPNGGRRNLREAARLKHQGVTKGIPDIFLAFPSGQYHGLFIELKRPLIKGLPKPAITLEQKEMIDTLRFQGYCVKVCYGTEEALDTILQYWKLED